MAKIKSIKGRQVFDSRGNPTVEAEVFLENNVSATAISPSGASTGAFETHELRDKDKNNFLGKSVNIAVENINGKILDKLKGLESDDQKNIDKVLLDLDGTENKKNLGANATLAVSLANSKCSAISNKKVLFKYLGNNFSLPIPLMNIINGGAHADNDLNIQEFMIRPDSAKNFLDAIEKCYVVIQNLKKILKSKKMLTNVGDEGGFAPNLGSNEEAVEVVLKAIEKAGYRPGEDVLLAMDAAASEFYDKESGLYKFASTGDERTGAEMVDFWKGWCDKYPIVSIEDGLDEDDWSAWKKLTDMLGERVQLVGDDLFVTNVRRLSRGIDEGVGNSILVKVNQIGTLSETIDAVSMAHRAGYTSVMSHRSGETEDATIADLAVATNCGQIKTGAPCRSDRVAKYNQLLRIESELGDTAAFLGADALAPR